MSDYDRFARLYDLEHRDFADDLVLYQDFARRCGSPVLDVGCGSGRVTMALARAGSDVVGIDNSAAMLEVARLHIVEAGLSERIQLLQQDVVCFEAEDQFTLALFALNGFLHLLTVKAQRAALRNLYRALLPGGLLIVDVPNPHTVFTCQQDGRPLLRSHFHLPQDGEAWCFVDTKTDLARQVQHLTLTYDEIAPADRDLGPDKRRDEAEGDANPTQCGAVPADQNGISDDGDMTPADWGQAIQDHSTIRRTRVSLDVRFVYHYEMTSLLQEAGFQVDAVYGSYDLTPYLSDSHQMLFVAYRPI